MYFLKNYSLLMIRERHVQSKIKFFNIEFVRCNVKLNTRTRNFANHIQRSFLPHHCLILHSTFPRSFYDGVCVVKCADSHIYSD